MGMKSPMVGLFPQSNNIDTSITRQTHYNSKANNSQTENIDHESISESVNTSLVKDIIQQEGWQNVDNYQDDVRNHRFYLTDRYENKTSHELNDMLNANIGSYSDFEKYDKKVEREFHLRKKIEEVFRSIDPGAVQIYSEELLEENFSAGSEVNGNLSHRNGEKTYLKNNSRFKKSSSFNNIKRLSANSYSNNDSVSLSTYVIDNASYGDMIIDDNKQYDSRPQKLEIVSTVDSNYYGGDNYNRQDSTWETAYKWFKKYVLGTSKEHTYHIQRKLTVRHIQMLSVVPCFSVGFFLNSGKAFSIGGPFGTLLGFTLTGSVVLATLLSFTELSALIPISSGFSGLASRFVEDAFGFAMGWTYWFSCLISFPAQAASSTFYLTYFSEKLTTKGATTGFVTLFISYPIILNLLSVNYMGESLFFFGVFKIVVSILMMFVMVILNSGHGFSPHERVGFRFWMASKSVGNMTYGLFRPTFDLSDIGEGSTNGTGGPWGRFLSLLSVMLISTFAYSGCEMTFQASGEAINPRKTIPSSIKRTFSIILSVYLLSLLTVGINIYSGDPKLLSYLPKASVSRAKAAYDDIGSQWQLEHTCKITSTLENIKGYYVSPWVLALQSFGFCTFASAFDALLIIFTSSAGISSIFNASRALYSMSIQRKAPHCFQVCSSNGVPYISVIFCGMFGVIAYLGVNNSSQDNFNILVNISSASTSIIWFGLNASFLRFYYALKVRSDYLSRDEETYPFKSPFQPFLAFYGLIGCFIFVLLMGFTTFLRHFWDVRAFFSAYGGLMIFSTCYLGFKIFGTSKLQRLDQLDMDTGRRELDRMFWTEHNQHNCNLREKMKQFFTSYP